MKAEALQVKNEEPQPLPDLFGKLGDDLTRLFDAKLSLLRIELREEMTTYIRGIVMMATRSQKNTSPKRKTSKR